MMNRSGKLSLDLRYIFLFVLAAWLIFNLVQTVGYVLNDYSQIPVEDFWRIPQFWADQPAIRWSKLWQQHNEHRILFPELIHIADMLLLHGRMYLSIAVSAACYFGIWCVLAWALYSQRALEPPAREAALLLAGIIIAWKGCSTAIATPFQLQFTMLQLVSTLSLLFLSKLADSGRNRYLAAVIAMGTVCTYCSGNGMLLWIVLIAAAVFLKLTLRQILILTLAAACFTGLYFFHYQFLPSQISTNIRHPIKAFLFLCSSFSMPFGGYGPRSYGFRIGAANLFLMTVCLVFAWRHGLLRSRLGIVVFGTYLFTLLSALLTTAGRMDLNDHEFALAKAWRYVTMPTVSWALLVIALIWMAEKVRSQNWALLAALGFGIFFYLGFKKDADWVESTRLDTANAQITATMLRNGVFDPNQVRTTFPDAEFVRVTSLPLQKYRKSIYADGDDRWIDGDLLSLKVQGNPVAGKITRVLPVPGGIEIFGWADTKSLTMDHKILFVDDANRIAGFGRRPAAGLPADLSAWDTPNRLAFVGYVSLARPISRLTVWVRTYGGRLIQPMNQTIDVPAFTQLEDRLDTAPLPGITWVPDTNWTLRGYEVVP